MFIYTMEKWTPLHRASQSGDVDKVRELLEGGKYDVNCVDEYGWTPLHLAACRGHMDVVRLLITEFKADVNVHNNNGVTPLHEAASRGHLDVVRVLISEFKADVNIHSKSILLHEAASRGNLDVVRMIISKSKADVNVHNDSWLTPLHEAASRGHLDVVRVLISEFKADVNVINTSGSTPLHEAASRGHLDVVRVLISEFKADVNVLNNDGGTPLHEAASKGHLDVVRVLSEFKADVNALNNDGGTPLHEAASKGHLDVVRVLSEFKADVNALNNDGGTPLHEAASKGHLDVVRVLSEFKADVNALAKNDHTPYDVAVRNNKEEVAVVLMNEFHCDTKGGPPYILTACERGMVNLVRALVQKHGTNILNDITARDNKGNTPLHAAANAGSKDVVQFLIEIGCDVNVTWHLGRSLLHSACASHNDSLVRLVSQHISPWVVDDNGDTPLHICACLGKMNMVRVLISEFKADVNTLNKNGHTIFDEAVRNNNEKIAVVLMNEFHCDTKGGTPYIHTACERGWVHLVQALVQKHGTGIVNDITARDNEGNTPLHVAAIAGSKDVVKFLIEIGCDVNVTGHLGRSLLHSACASDNGSLVRLVSQHISPWVVDNNGDTPLHICARLGKIRSVRALLELDPPVMIRNNLGKTPRDLEKHELSSYNFIGVYLKDNEAKIYSQYEVVQRHAKKKYSRPEPITRAFVVGNPGAGKSSLVEALKKEGFVDSFKRVSESSVPPHTAGIVPSIHTSKHYGRVLFYDFAGDAEYYSSHAAILENLASSRKGNNIFILVIDMREEMAEIKKIFHYWLSFIQYQNFHMQKPRLIVVGSHLDLLTEDVAKARGKELQMFYNSIDSTTVKMSALFMLDCCKPRSKQIGEIKTLMSKLTKDSPSFKLSLKASILLGLLEKDFSSVPACSTPALLSHIEETGIQLIQSLHPILLELHDLGLLFLIDISSRESSSVVLNMSQLTNTVHKSLFSKKDILKESFEKEGLSFSFSAGIVPQSILANILPENITKECLVQLQYCQEISHAEAHVFPSLKVSDSTDQSFLFFPALCSADKSEVEWVTPPDLSYGIGWLARCTDPCDYLSQRFHHVLMLRLVFKFTLSAHPQAGSGLADFSHFQRRCTVWKTGVHWLMEEGVECMVELAGANREVVVLTRSTKDRAENCAAVFNDIVSCVMEAKAEFCHSVRLEFFLLDSTSEADYLSADNLFAMRDVERVLTCAEGRAEVIVSVSGKRQMERSKLLCLRNFTLWYSLFPMDFKSVLHYIKDVVRELYMLGLHLGIPKGILDAI